MVKSSEASLKSENSKTPLLPIITNYVDVFLLKQQQNCFVTIYSGAKITYLRFEFGFISTSWRMFACRFSCSKLRNQPCEGKQTDILHFHLIRKIAKEIAKLHLRLKAWNTL